MRVFHGTHRMERPTLCPQRDWELHLQRTVRELERSASELERERDEARQAAWSSRDANEEPTEACRKKFDARRRLNG